MQKVQRMSTRPDLCVTVTSYDSFLPRIPMTTIVIWPPLLCETPVWKMTTWLLLHYMAKMPQITYREQLSFRQE